MFDSHGYFLNFLVKFVGFVLGKRKGFLFAYKIGKINLCFPTLILVIIILFIYFSFL